jgi:Flp pilus assembly protein TadG
MKSCSKLFRRLLRSQRGAVAPLFLVTAVAVLGASLGGIDLVRYSVAQGRLQNALDGATLSAGRNLANLTPKEGTPQADQWQTDAYEYFRSNMPDGYMGSSIQPEDLQIVYSEEVVDGKYITGQHIEMSVKGDLPLLSTGFLSVSSFGIQASNKALRRTRADLELVMALDNTGSMKGARLTTLKTAAKELSSTVLGAAQASGAPGRVFVGLVPFADTVNVGNTPATRQWLNGSLASEYFTNTLWRGCIAEPAAWGGGNLPASVLTPSSAFQPLHLTLRTNINRSSLGLENNSSGNNYERIAPSTASQPQPRAYAAGTGQNAAYDRRVWAARNSNQTSFDVYSAHNPSNCRSNRKTRFLTNDANELDAAINAMDADGYTLIPTGLLWAWRMLHPAWSGEKGWGHPDMPREPDPKILRKAIVLLTDGKNEPPSGAFSTDDSLRLAFRLEYDAQRCTNSGRTNCNAALLARTFTSSSNFNATSASQAPMTSLKMRDPYSQGGNSLNGSIGWGSGSRISQTTVDAYLAALCANVKKDVNNIKIYTVTLGNVGTSTEELMNVCSSGAGYFYNANNVSDLPLVFRSIAGALTELRLTQ